MMPHIIASTKLVLQPFKRLVATTAAICGAMLVMAAPASAQISTRSGTISSVFLSGGNNYPFRVTLMQNGASPMTDCKGSFAYVAINNDNYQAYVAALTTLYVRATPVTLTIIPDSNGFCQLLEFGT